MIQDVAVYDRALDFKEIVSHYWIAASGYPQPEAQAREKRCATDGALSYRTLVGAIAIEPLYRWCVKGQERVKTSFSSLYLR